MPVDQATLGSFGDLGIALGLLLPNGQPNPSWFSDPISGGTGPRPNGLKHLMEDDDQRSALLRFVDGILGPPDARQGAGVTWVPLLQNADPAVTVSAVVQVQDNEVRLGFGLEHTTAGGPPTVSTRVHVPVFRFPERDHPLVSAGSTPVWLALGRPGGAVEITVDATLADPPPSPGLGGAGLTIQVPTDASDVGFEVTLRDLRLPGSTAPQTFTLDVGHPAQLVPRLLDLLTGLVRGQADALDLDDPALRPFAALAGLLGLREVPGLPELPLAQLPTDGVSALVAWVQQLLDEAALDAWLGQLALLVGGTADAAANAVRIRLGAASGVGRVDLAIGLRLDPGPGSHPVLTPWVELSLLSRDGVVARAAVDLLSLDSATGACSAVPDARLEAVFGVAAGGGRVVDVTGELEVDTLRVGVGVDVRRAATGEPRPAFVLTAHTVLVDGVQRDLVDLSTPDAALGAGIDLVTARLRQALTDLGDAGDLVARLIGITGTGSVSALDAADLIADPLGAVRAHWLAVLQHTDAMQDLLGRLSALVRGQAPAPATGDGTPALPWEVVLADAVHLEVVRRDARVDVTLLGQVQRTLFTDLAGTVSLRFGVATLDLGVPSAVFATGASLEVGFGRPDGTPARWEIGEVALEAGHLGIAARWQPQHALRLDLDAEGLALDLLGTHVDLPLPQFSEEHGLQFESPDWDQIEDALAALLQETGLDEVKVGLALLGWTGGGPHLALSALLDGDPVTAITTWLADLLLDCGRLRTVLTPVAALLSGFSLGGPTGSGNPSDPFRCPVAGEPRAPGLRVWADPGCPQQPGAALPSLAPLSGSLPPDPETLAAALRRAGAHLPGVADLMVGRDSLGAGFEALASRWTDTDGFVGRSTTIPAAVDVLELAGVSYAELVALGCSGQLHGRVLPTGTDADAVLHVGTSADLLNGRPAGAAYDLSGDQPPSALTGSGPWFVRLPSPQAAATARPDRGAVGEQAARLAALLEGHAGPVVLVGYGDAGAAAIRAAAASDSQATDVVTVGTPWADTALLSLATGSGGDALQLLGRLQRPDVPRWPDELLGGQCTALQRTRLLVERYAALLRPDSLVPRADTEAVRSGLRVHAVFGRLDRPTVLRGLGAFVTDAVTARAEALADPDPGAVATVHVGVDLPVLDLDLGGLLVGVGASVETCRLSRPASGEGLDVEGLRSLVVEVHLGFHDGWLVGGPGSSGGTGDLRWMSARVEIPLDGGAGTSELVLHEVRALGVDRERWVVRGLAESAAVAAADVAAGVTTAVPEVRVLLGDVVGRLSGTVQLRTLLDRLSLRTPAGGLDLDGLDRFLHDPAVTLRGLVAAAPAELAELLRGLVPAATGTGTTVGWPLGPATVTMDLATGHVTGVLDSHDGVPLHLSVAAGPAGTSGAVTVGRLDPDLGGVELTAAAAAGTGVTAQVAWAAAGSGSAPPSTAQLWPAFEPLKAAEVAALTLPAAVLQAVLRSALDQARETTRAAIEAGLRVTGLLEAQTDGTEPCTSRWRSCWTRLPTSWGSRAPGNGRWPARRTSCSTRSADSSPTSLRQAPGRWLTG